MHHITSDLLEADAPASRPAGALAYCAVVAAAACVVLASIAAVNAIVDPFDMYGRPRIEGINGAKPAVYHRVRLFKAFEVRRVRPRAVVLGSSRAHIGFRCSHPAWDMDGAPCYNLAFDGATTREMFAYLRHAHAIRPLTTAVLALDTYHLAGGPSFARPDFDPLLLSDPERPWPLTPLTADARLLTSLDTLRASIDTVTGQAVEPRWFAADGQRLGAVFFREVEAGFRELGPRGYFDRIDEAEVGYQTEGLVLAATPPRATTTAPAAPPDPEQSSFADIRRIVEFALEEHIDLRIVITPAHAHQYEIASAAGAWPAMQEGKRRLVHLLADMQAARRESTPIPLWDFSGYSSVTTEALPGRGSQTEMRYYWDSSHFKDVVGDFVLSRVFGREVPGAAVPPDFGTQLTMHSTEAVLAADARAQALYRRREPGPAAHLRALVGRALTAGS